MLTALVILCLCASSLYVGNMYGRYCERARLMLSLSKSEAASLAVRRLTRALRSRSQFEQDLWVVTRVAPGKKNGFYVDVGSADGQWLSNTGLLDELGWRGICVDPYPKNMQRRTCQVFRQPVFSESGKKVRFRQAGDMGGIEANLHSGLYTGITGAAPSVELVTTTLDEILAAARAPQYIDYISLDVEGAEHAALLGLTLERYEVGAFTIEHNFDVQKREAIRKLLEDKGYVRVQSWVVDDFYVNKRLASRFPAADKLSSCGY
jgi:FkbM family methyltransferase